MANMEDRLMKRQENMSKALMVMMVEVIVIQASTERHAMH